MVERRGLKALSATVVRAAPNDDTAHQMRAMVLSGSVSLVFRAWEAGPCSTAELREAAMHFERAAELCPAPEMKAQFAGNAALSRGLSAAM